MKNFRHSKI